jgi:hypothetical protein
MPHAPQSSADLRHHPNAVTGVPAAEDAFRNAGVIFKEIDKKWRFVPPPTGDGGGAGTE